MCGFCKEDPDDAAWNPWSQTSSDDLFDSADEARDRAKEEA